MTILPVKFLHFAQCLFLAGLTLFANQAHAERGDETFLAAKAAYDQKNSLALSELVNQLNEQQYVLAPYAAYWSMLLNLELASDAEVEAFLSQYQTLPFADRLRGEWLKVLAKQQNWLKFLEVSTQYQLDDAAITCYVAEANAVVHGVNTLASAKPLWLRAKEQPSNCNRLYDRMQAAQVLTEEDLIARFRLALADSRVTLAKGIANRSSLLDAAFSKQIDLANTSPQLAINKRSIATHTRYGKELYLFALLRMAKTDSAQALEAMKKVQSLLNAEEKSYFYALLAHEAAKRQEAEAYSWFRLAEHTTLNKEQFEWYARSALRAGDWKALLEVTNAMPSDQADEATWRYWRARALKAHNNLLEANALFAKLSTERHFYGWLAQEELESSMSAQAVVYTPSEEDIVAFTKLDAVKRAEALQRLDFRWESKQEWALATSGLDDRQLLAAAEYAFRKKWFDLSVLTADKTTEMHNFDLRYPTPYRDLMKPAANNQAIDEAWAYGIIRQESRFMHYAKSNVGAAGLMQIMPATAKWIAKKVGITNYDNSMIHDLDANITLGTHYMKYALDQFDGQEVMATAAYNAGPSRAKKWRANTPLEGAIYAETIPFSETRNYVKRVMENAHLYAQRLGLKVIPLKARLGVIPSKYSEEQAFNSTINE
ncbi:MAG TPA: transglycosylase SLT domain-containing protein [Methylophilus sp.]